MKELSAGCYRLSFPGPEKGRELRREMIFQLEQEQGLQSVAQVFSVRSSLTREEYTPASRISLRSMRAMRLQALNPRSPLTPFYTTWCQRSAPLNGLLSVNYLPTVSWWQVCGQLMQRWLMAPPERQRVRRSMNTKNFALL